MAPARFLHIFGTFDPGGTETRTVQLMEAFGADARHVVLVADPKSQAARSLMSANVDAIFPTVEARLVSGRPHPARLMRIARAMQGHDLILTYAWGAMDFVLAHRLFGRALALPPLIHHEDGLDPPRRGLSDALRVNYRRLAMHGADCVVVPSLSLANFSCERWRVPPQRLQRIVNGIALRSDPAPKPIPGLRQRAGETLVCTAAGLRKEKNLPRLVRAGARAGEDIRIAILGEGPERSAILGEAERLGSADRLHLTGFLVTARECLGSADIFALSSDTEQCPLALIEAMAAGMPIVATNVGDVVHMVAPENLPFVVEAADEESFAKAIRRLADDPALRRTIGAANAAKARAIFGADQMVTAYRDLYWSLIARP